MVMLMSLQFIAENGHDIATNVKVRTCIVAKGCLSARGLERLRFTQDRSEEEGTGDVGANSLVASKESSSGYLRQKGNFLLEEWRGKSLRWLSSKSTDTQLFSLPFLQVPTCLLCLSPTFYALLS